MLFWIFLMLHHDVRDILFLIKLSVLIQFLKLFSNCLSNSNRIRNCGFRSARLDYESTDDSALLDSFNGPSVWQLYCERCELRLPRIRSKSIFSRFSIILSTYAPSESRRTTADLQDFPLSWGYRKHRILTIFETFLCTTPHDFWSVGSRPNNYLFII